MPFQHRPPPSPVEDSRSSPSSPSLSPKLRANTNPRPALRTSISDPDSGLTIPFEQLSLQDQQVFWQAHQHQQDIQFVSYPHTRAPRDPSIGVELEQEEEYLVEGMFRNRIGEDGARGKNVEHSSQPQHGVYLLFRNCWVCCRFARLQACPRACVGGCEARHSSLSWDMCFSVSYTAPVVTPARHPALEFVAKTTSGILPALFCLTNPIDGALLPCCCARSLLLLLHCASDHCALWRCGLCMYRSIR